MTTRTQIDLSDVKSLGVGFLSLTESIVKDDLKPILDKYHIDEVIPDQWYPLQMVLDVLEDIKSRPDGSEDMVAIGLSLADKILLLPEFKDADIHTLLNSWGQNYKVNHQSNHDIGNVVVEQVSEQHLKVILSIVYPDDMSYGMAFAYARRGLPKGTEFAVYYDEEEPRLDHGGERTIIHVTWGEVID